MVNYPVGDFLVRVKNAAMASKNDVEIMSSKLVKETANVLKKEGFLESVSEKDGKLLVQIKFHKKEPMLIDLRVVSRPGLRVYMNLNELAKRKAASMLILSTAKGVMSSKDALKKGAGGEIIAEVW